MCVLSKISGLKDKIRTSETRNAILNGESVSANKGKSGENKKSLRNHEEIVERRKNCCKNRRDDLLTIKIGVQKRPEVETGNVWGEDERLSQIIRPNKVSVASSRPRFFEDDTEVLAKTRVCENGDEVCRYLGSSSPPRLPEQVKLKRQPSRRCTQHWESMINAGPRGLSPLKEESRSIVSSAEVARCDQPVFKRRGSTDRRDCTSLEGGCLIQGDKNEHGIATVAITEYEESQAASKSRSNFAHRRKERRLARSWLPSFEAESEPAAQTTSIFRKMASGLFEIFGTNSKLREANAPPRIKVLYRRTPNCGERRVRKDRTGNKAREEICGDCDEKKR